METLYSEILEYLTIYDPEKNLTIDDVKKSVKNYGDFVKTLIPASVPKTLHKYINIPHIIYDMYQDNKILIFRYKEADIDSISSEEYEAPEHTVGFINGVKILDDMDIREQIVANEYTGGYWDERIHWIYFQ
jgi:hypothetical protein